MKTYEQPHAESRDTGGSKPAYGCSGYGLKLSAAFPPFTKRGHNRLNSDELLESMR
jgi:hypothetical protein